MPIVPRLTKINMRDVLCFLSYSGGEVPEEIKALIETCSEQIMKAARPQLVYRVFPHDGDIEGAPIPLIGNDVTTMLKDCHQMVFMAVTLGPDVETLLMRTQISDMAKAVVMDGCASVAVENICDNFSADLADLYKEEGFFTTDRFSPGYGDLPLDLQKPLCDLLDTGRKIGLNVSLHNIMIPRKSVTAVIGVAKTEQPHRPTGCESCSMRATCRIHNKVS